MHWTKSPPQTSDGQYHITGGSGIAIGGQGHHGRPKFGVNTGAILYVIAILYLHSAVVLRTCAVQSTMNS